MGIDACLFFQDLILGKPRDLDSLELHYYTVTRDFVSIQNTSGYETLKSKGLELIQTDSLRTEIISLYEFDYTILRKLEEDYDEMQFHTSFFKEFNAVFAPHFEFSDKGRIIGITKFRFSSNNFSFIIQSCPDFVTNILLPISSMWRVVFPIIGIILRSINPFVNMT